MRGILSYSLPEDRDDFETAQNGWKYKLVIEELFNWIRSETKYLDKETVTFEALREKIAELMDAEDI